MIVSIWVFFLLGEPIGQEHGTPYVQHTASRYVHDVHPDWVEKDAYEEFRHNYPGHAVIDGGWHRQEVKVMGQ